MLFNYKRIAKTYSFNSVIKRDYKQIKYIVIHYTSGANDTAKNECDYFATGNTRSAGAHYFVDQKGKCGKSINLNRIAYSVGGLYTTKNGAGKYYKKCTNANSVSIELCGNLNKFPSDKQKKKVIKLIKYIRKHCPNAKTIIRHYDVNGKQCPLLYVRDEAKWKAFKREIDVW